MNKKKTTREQRKTPSQERSRATVDAIIQATTYILIESGWSGLTTNAIAERAGVNISSLYQFFKNKEAIIAELQSRHVTETHAGLHNAIKNLPAQSSFRETLTILVELLVKKHQIAPALHKVLTEEIPLTSRCVLDEDNDLREPLIAILRPFMKNVPDPDFAIYMVGIATDAIINQVTISRPNLLNETKLVTEIVTLLERYLDRSE